MKQSRGYWNLETELLRRSVTFNQGTQPAQGGYTGRHPIPPLTFQMAKPKKISLVMGTHGCGSYPLPHRAEFDGKECVHQVNVSVPPARGYANFL